MHGTMNVKKKRNKYLDKHTFLLQFELPAGVDPLLNLGMTIP